MGGGSERSAGARVKYYAETRLRSGKSNAQNVSTARV